MATEYGKRLKKAMAHAKLNQKGLIAATGLKQSTVSSAMNRSVGSSDTPAYAAACGVSALWLATGDGEMLIPGGEHKSKPIALADATHSAKNVVATMAEITAALSAKFEEMDASTRKLAVALIGQLADDPQDHARIAAMIDLSIVSRGRKAA